MSTNNTSTQRSGLAGQKRPHTPTNRRGRKSDASVTVTPIASPNLDLKEAIDAARKTFKKDLKNSASSTPASLSPKPLNQQGHKSASAPVSPVKLTDSARQKPDKPLAKMPKRLRRSANSINQSESKVKDVENAKTAEAKFANTKENKEKPKKDVSKPEESQKSTVDESKRRPSNNVSMNEVIKLHQDEGVMHLLHALPSSRRKPTQMVSIVARRPSANGPEPQTSNVATTNVVTANIATTNSLLSTQTLDQSAQVQPPTLQIPPMGDVAQPADPSVVKKVLQARQTNSLPEDPERKVKPCNQEELMTAYALGLLKQLPSKEYIKLWSSPARYVLVDNDNTSVMVTVQTSGANLNIGATVSTSSPSSSVSSDMSSVSNSRPQIQIPRPVAWTINSKHYKDILIRPYKSFAQVIMSPVTTGLKNSLNANVCEELIDALKQLGNEAECRAVLVTGIGHTFCQGIDLTVLTYDSADRQRRSAEHLAGAVKRLVAFLISYPKILIAAVNGVARGAGVTLLPYFDMVFASDKATFSADYSKLGQIPECFPSYSLPSGHLAINELFLFCKTATASEAVRYGLVSTVVWPDKFLEEIVPRVEMLESIPGLRSVKMNMKQFLKKSVSPSVMEEETKTLIQNWSQSTFAKNTRAYLKQNRLLFQ